MTRLFALSLLVIAWSALADETASCAYPDKNSRNLEAAENCGSISADGLLTIEPEIIERIDWNKFGLVCAYVYGTQDKDGWFFISQTGRGRISPFLQDNDCAPFAEGVAAGLSQGKVVYYNQALDIVERTDYIWTSGFFKGYAKVCAGDLVKEFDAGGEHFDYRGGRCGFIDAGFEVVVPVTYPYENTPEPETR